MGYKCRFILSDIEGTTSSISFVNDELFPYFRKNIDQVTLFAHLPQVKNAFNEIIAISQQEEGTILTTSEDVKQKLLQWSLADKKYTPLKMLQGLIWEKGYKLGELKGHMYDDVAPSFEKWKLNGIDLGIYSSGSVAAQELIFKYASCGDMTKWISHYFDTRIGGKRESRSYEQIVNVLGIIPGEIVFLSDIEEELSAANQAGLKTIHLLRNDNDKRSSSYFARDFLEVDKLLHQI